MIQAYVLFEGFDPNEADYNRSSSLQLEVEITSLLGTDFSTATEIADFNVSKVNFHQGKYVRPDGTASDGGEKVFAKYYASYVNDDGDTIETIEYLEIRVQDTTPPEFELVDPTGSSITIEAGNTYTDANISGITDNYDTSIGLDQITAFIFEGDANLTDPDPAERSIFDVIEDNDIGFWKTGTFKLWYQVRDDFSNSYDQNYKPRTITVIDTQAPSITLINHVHLSNLSQFADKRKHTESFVISPDAPVDLSSSDSSSPYYVVKHENGSAFYLISSEWSNIGDAPDFDNTNNALELPWDSLDSNLTIRGADYYSRSFVWHSAFKLQSSSDPNVYFQDLGVYVENLSDSNTSVSSEINAFYDNQLSVDTDDTEDNSSQLVKFEVTYNATQGGVTSSVTREYFFLDEELPQIYLSPSSTSVTPFILEAGVHDVYDDTTIQSVTLDDGTVTEEIDLITQAFDIIDDNLDIQITVYSGLLDNPSGDGLPNALLDIDHNCLHRRIYG